jgi:transcriptional regulator with XRE-family HTH domain
MNQVHQSIGLEVALEERRLSQAQLARATGKSEAQVNRWVKGKVVPSRDNQDLILRALNEPVEKGFLAAPRFVRTDVWGSDA